MGQDQQPAAVSVRELVHRYAVGRKRKRGAGEGSVGDGSRDALGGVSFDVRAGEVFGVLGPNGGGKTTLFKILSTVLVPTGGRALVFGDDVVERADRVRARLGVVFQHPSLDGKLTVAENLTHQGNLYGLSGARLWARIDEELERFGLADRAGSLVETLSGGLKRRAELAKAMLHRPRLLLLDEPSTGLDPAARRGLSDYLDRVRRDAGVTVLITTHLMDEAERCDRLAILAGGRLVGVDTPARLKGAVGGDVIAVEPAEQSGEGETDRELAGAIAERFGPWEVGGEPRVVAGRVQMRRAGGAEVVGAIANEFGERVQRVSFGRPTLEDVFLDLTGDRLDGGAGGGGVG